eukprot:5736665-Prymnesium_polylepis.1
MAATSKISWPGTVSAADKHNLGRCVPVTRVATTYRMCDDPPRFRASQTWIKSAKVEKLAARFGAKGTVVHVDGHGATRLTPPLRCMLLAPNL